MTRMKHIDLVIPFALPPAEMAKDLLSAIQAPSFSILASKAKQNRKAPSDSFARALPHEAWLTERFGIDSNESGSPGVAAPTMRAFGLRRDEGFWFILQPVHIHIARDHLVLTDLRKLSLEDKESRSFFDAAQALCSEAGHELLYGDARTWILRADDWRGLTTSTPDAACGHNIDIWMPKGAHERDWRRLQNEIQMHWHTHPANAARELQGKEAVNSLWLWGGSRPELRISSDYESICAPSGWMHAFDTTTRSNSSCSAADILANAASVSLAVLDDLSSPALASDWGTWLENMNALESLWFEPLLSALKNGTLDGLNLILTDDVRLVTLGLNRLSLKKFWATPSLQRLAS
jgi:hypothetical protein